MLSIVLLGKQCTAWLLRSNTRDQIQDCQNWTGIVSPLSSWEQEKLQQGLKNVDPMSHTRSHIRGWQEEPHPSRLEGSLVAAQQHPGQPSGPQCLFCYFSQLGCSLQPSFSSTQVTDYHTEKAMTPGLCKSRVRVAGSCSIHLLHFKIH